MWFLRALSFRIYLAVAIPTGAFLIVSGLAITDKLAVDGQMRHLKEQVSFATAAGAIIHELQKERGASSLYLGSKGQQFGPELETQRTLTDTRLAAVIDQADRLRAEGVVVTCGEVSLTFSGLKTRVSDFVTRLRSA